MMDVKWEYWPKPMDGTQDDPISGAKLEASILSAMSLMEQLREQYRDRLRFVTFTTTVYQNTKSQ